MDTKRIAVAPDSAAAHPPAALDCPFCGSTQTTTTSKSPDDRSYWRCRACGDIWNASRLTASKRRGW